MVFLVLVVAGIVLLVSAGTDIGISASGVGYALIAGGSYATYVIAARQFSRNGEVIGPTAVILTIAAALLVPLLGTGDLAWVGTRAGSVTILHLGLMATALAYLLFATGLRGTKSTTATTMTLGEPLTATILGIVVVGERPPLLGWVGFALVLAALAAVATEGRSNRLFEPRRLSA